jgi:hypothetical protein
MKNMAQLIQTILWVGLIGAFGWRYDKQLRALLEAIQKRVESGSSIKVGPVEISELQPQNSEQQRENVVNEINQAIDDSAPPGRSGISPEPQSREKIVSRYYLAEDLALRAIQTEYGVPINRQIRAGRLQLDGMFAKDGKGHIVEVKYRLRPFPEREVQQIVDNIFAGIALYGWRNVKIILAIVYDDGSSNLDNEERRLIELFRSYKGTVDVHCFSLEQLEREFGILP